MMPTWEGSPFEVVEPKLSLQLLVSRATPAAAIVKSMEPLQHPSEEHGQLQ
jgi:hypothetical protein